jgi:hypothetical protein
MSTEAPSYPYPGEIPESDREQWKVSKDGREYTTTPTRRGVIYREGDETIEQARERDSLPREERRPRKRKPMRKVPDPPREADLKELESILTEALKQPGLIAAAFGDEWAAEHFVTMAPAVSRNLVTAAKHNPWLKRKLEEAATGQDAAMAIVSLVPLGGAVLMYLVPPIIYWFDLPVSERGRKMLGDIPHRNGRPAPTAEGPPVPHVPPFAPAGTAAPPPAYATSPQSTDSTPADPSA